MFRFMMRHMCIAAAALAAGLCSTHALGQAAGRAVFVVNNVSDEITSLLMNADGSLTFVSNTPTSDGPLDADLTPDGKYLLVTHGTASDTTEFVYVYRVNADATLVQVESILVPDSPLAAQWISDTIVAITKSNLSVTNEVITYAFDRRSATLTDVDSEPTGSFSTYLAKHPTHPILYAQDSFGNTIQWFDVAPDGALTPGGSQSTGSIFPLDLVLTNDGSFLYSAGGISGGGGDKVTGFNVAPDGDLAALSSSPFVSPGASPAHVMPSSDDALLFVGHGTDATVRSFFIDDRTGSLTSTGNFFDVGLQGTLGDLAVMDDVLLVTDESTATDGITGIYSVHINADGSFNQIAPIVLTGGVRPETIVVWKPPLAADLDGDGVVGPGDLAIVLGNWGPCAQCPSDLDGDGVVGPSDLAIVLGNWGTNG